MVLFVADNTRATATFDTQLLHTLAESLSWVIVIADRMGSDIGPEHETALRDIRGGLDAAVTL